MTIESSGAINFNPEFASIATRFAGFLIDSVATVAALAPGIAILAVGSGALRFSGILITMVGLLLVARWYSSSVSTSGQWIGNRVTNTKVVDVTSGDLLDQFAGSIVTRPTRESWSVHDDPSTDNAPDSKSAQ